MPLDDCLDYAKVQETLGTIYLMTAKLSQAKTHFKKAFKIYEKIWTDEPEMIEAKYQEIQFRFIWNIITTHFLTFPRKHILLPC